jgi:hypothetical protein
MIPNIKRMSRVLIPERRRFLLYGTLRCATLCHDTSGASQAPTCHGYGRGRHPRSAKAPGADAPQPGSPSWVSTVKPHASNRAGAATLSAGSCNASFDSIQRYTVTRGLGDDETACKRKCLHDLVAVKPGIQSGPRRIAKACDECGTRRLLRRQKWRRPARGNLAQVAPGETRGR